MKANEAPETYLMQFRDKIDEYLFKEHHIAGGCSSIESLKYIAAREVAEKLTDVFIEKACEWLKNNSHNYANNALGKEYLVNDFINYMKGV